MSRSPDEERSRTVLDVSALAALAFFYSAFVVGQLLLGGLVVLFLFVLCSLHRLFGLLRRFVRAHERIAAALESPRVPTWGETTTLGNGKGPRFPIARSLGSSRPIPNGA